MPYDSSTPNYRCMDLKEPYQSVSLASRPHDLAELVRGGGFTTVFDGASSGSQRRLQRYLGKQGVIYQPLALNETEPWSLQLIGDSVLQFDDAYQNHERMLVTGEPGTLGTSLMTFLWLKYRQEPTGTALAAIWGENRSTLDTMARSIFSSLHDPEERIIPPCLPEYFEEIRNGSQPKAGAERRMQRPTRRVPFDPANPGIEDTFALKTYMRR